MKRRYTRAHLRIFKVFQILPNINNFEYLCGNQIKKLITPCCYWGQLDRIDKRCLIIPIYVLDNIKMAELSNCIYRAYSSSKFIMKSLLRFLP